MELLIIVSILLLIKFIFSWIKVTFFMWSASMKGSSFKMTFAYLLGKHELRDLIK